MSFFRASPGLVRLALALVCLFCAAASARAEPTNVTFLSLKTSSPKVWSGLIDRFQAENPGVRVNLQVGPHSSTQLHDILSQRLKNRDASMDVFLMDVIWPPEFAAAGWVLDLTGRFPPEERAQFLDGPMEANTYRGRVWGVPAFLAAGLLYYRRDLLDKYGLKPAITWPELVGQGQVILAGEKDPTLRLYSGQFKQYEGLVCDMLEFVWSAGGRVYDPAGRARLDDPAWPQALRFVRDRIIGAAAPRGALAYAEPESLALFVQGRAVYLRNWPYAWRIAGDPKKSRVAGRVGVTLLPRFPGGRPAAALGGWQFGINRYSRHPDAAWRFVKFMTSPDSQKALVLGAGRSPTRRAVYADPEVQARMPHLARFLPAFEAARPRPASPLYPMVSQELQRMFSRAIAYPDSDLAGLLEASARRLEEIEALVREAGQ